MNETRAEKRERRVRILQRTADKLRRDAAECLDPVQATVARVLAAEVLEIAAAMEQGDD